MVKSYRGVKAPNSKPETNSKRVRDYMATKLITFHPDQSILEVMDTLIAKRISGSPVINDKKELVGVISEGDCLKEIAERKYFNSVNLPGKVKDHMSTVLTTISPDTSILDAAELFLKERKRRFPVMENGRLVGLLTQNDIMKAVVALKGATWR